MTIDPDVYKGIGAMVLAVLTYVGGNKRGKNNGVDPENIERRNDTVRVEDYNSCRKEWKKEFHDMRQEAKQDNNRIYDKMTEGFQKNQETLITLISKVK